MEGREKVIYNGSIFKDQEEYIIDCVKKNGTSKAVELRRLLGLGISEDNVGDYPKKGGK